MEAATGFQEKINLLAAMLVTQVGVRAGDYVLLHSYTGTEVLAGATKQAAYDAGARVVEQFVCDPATVRAELLAQPGKDQYEFDPVETAAWQRVMDENGCTIQLRLDPDPALWDGVDHGRWFSQMWAARGDYFARAVAGGEFPWILFYVPTDSMARTIYPEVPPEEALATYWNAIFEMTKADQPDYLAQLQASDQTLHNRAETLDALGITILQFTGPGTDLRVGLSSAARWLGGSKLTTHTNPRRHTPNMPTYELYTTPDWRTVEGTVVITKDVLIDAALVSGAHLTFTDGRATAVSAETGAKALQAFIDRDPGAAQVGEIALVGLDSPTAARRRVFRSMLLDENGACHFAFGSAYLAAINQGDQLSQTERDALGINVSSGHHDFMISNQHTTVTATTATGDTIVLIQGGHWTPELL